MGSRHAQLNRSPETRKTCGAAVRQFAKFQADRDADTTTEVGAADIRRYLVDVLDRTSDSTAVTRWGGLTGLRRSECASILLEDLDLMAQTIKVMGKGGRECEVHIENGTALALRKYLRARRHHRLSDQPELWLGKLGPLKGSGIQQMLQRRAAKAGVRKANPHAWRHGLAHRWLSAGGTEGDLMSEAGWRSSQMVRRYADQQRPNAAGRSLRWLVSDAVARAVPWLPTPREQDERWEAMFGEKMERRRRAALDAQAFGARGV